MVLNPEVKDDSKKMKENNVIERIIFRCVYQKLLASSDFYKHENEIQRIARFFFSTVEPDKKAQQVEIYREAKNDPRNPYD